MISRWVVVAMTTAAVGAVAPGTAYAQPDDVGVDVPITVVLGDAQSGACTFSFTPRSNVTRSPIGAGMYERGTNRLYGVSNCGSVTNRVTVTDVAPGLPAVSTTGTCTTTTACTAVAAQYAGYPTGFAGKVEFLTRVTARGVSVCYADHWAVVGGVTATYVGGGFTDCSAVQSIIGTDERQIS